MAEDGRSQESSSSFDDWLFRVVAEYKRLTDDERNQTLDTLIDLSSSTQLRYLQSRVEILVYRDYFRLLPSELTDYILTFLNPESLLQCCLVNTHWNSIVSTNVNIWYQACVNLELKISADKYMNSALEWKKMYINMSNLLAKMQMYKTFKNVSYLGHTIRVTAVHYWNQKIATGSDDHTVRIWDCAQDVCTVVISTECTVASIKFDENVLLVSSYAGFLKAFCLKTTTLLRAYIQHTAAVFTFDYDYSFDLLASGGADDTIRLWSLNKGAPLTTLRGHDHWVITVVLTITTNEALIILSMDKHEIRIWSAITDKNPPHFVKCTQRIPTAITNFNFFTPGMHCIGNNVYFIKQDPVSTGVTLLCCWDMNKRTMVFQSELNHRVKILLGVGKKYFSIVTPTQDNDRPNFLVLSLKTLKPIAQWHIPPSRSSSPGNTQMILGDRDWLDGLDANNHSGVVIAAGLEDCSFYILKWSNEDNDSEDSFQSAIS